MVRHLDANSGSLLLSPQVNYIGLSESPAQAGGGGEIKLEMPNPKGASRSINRMMRVTYPIWSVRHTRSSPVIITHYKFMSESLVREMSALSFLGISSI